MEKISHFSHDHLLKFYSPEFIQPDDPETYNWCGACFRRMDSTQSAYSCRKCEYFIHKSCGELPRHLNHPFHPQHTLFLPRHRSDYLPDRTCNACGISCRTDFTYRCCECEFTLHLDCAMLSPTSKNQGGEMMHLIDPPHPLFICDKPVDYVRSCCCCGLGFSETDSKIYVCIECSHVLHESCAPLKEIIHPFHTQHPLTLFPSPQNETNTSIKCNACSSRQYENGGYMFKNGLYMFKCTQCDFALDSQCAALVPAYKRIGLHQVVQKPGFYHKHPLIVCNFIKEFEHWCGSCHQRIEDSIFVCLDCGVLLHKQCAELPVDVKHPCHPQHPLQLTEREKDDYYVCWLCGVKSYSVFSYTCNCNIHLEPSCALTKPLVINCAFHEHSLCYFSKECNENIYINCNKCREFRTEEFLFCVECRYSSHLCCYPNLPPIVKHNCHSHPLTLTTSRIKDDPDDDDEITFYCNACKELRDVYHPTYYCEDCHFVVHPRCVVSEILQYLETGSTVKTASPIADKLKKLETFDITDEVKGISCSLEIDKLEASKDSHMGKYGVCSAPSILNAESNSQPLYWKVANLSLSSSRLQDLPGFTRSVYKKDHALITPETHVSTPLPDWINTLGAYLIAPAMGSQFVMYLAKMKVNSKSGLPPTNVERFIFVVQGTATLTDASGCSHKLMVDSYAYFPPDVNHALKSDGSATLVVFERRYSYLENHMTELIVGSTDKQMLLETPGEIFQLRKLLPTALPYDFNIYIMDFQPGEFLNVKEVHFNEHGLLLLEGQGVYRLGDSWYPIQVGDAIWIAPLVPQWYAALGKTRTRYLLYKDVNRNSL